jgi:hypothetical protein
MSWLMTGCWVRAWIEFADGSRDDTSVVAWLQLPSLMADVRLPGPTAAGVDPSRRSLAECTVAELRAIADSESSSGYTTCTEVEVGDDGRRGASAVLAEEVQLDLYQPHHNGSTRAPLEDPALVDRMHEHLSRCVLTTTTPRVVRVRVLTAARLPDLDANVVRTTFRCRVHRTL